MSLITLEYFIVGTGFTYVALRVIQFSSWFLLFAGPFFIILRWLYVLELRSKTPISKFMPLDSVVRSQASHGLWCAILVPVALCLGHLRCQRYKYECSKSEDYLATSLASLPLLLATLIWINRDKRLKNWKCHSVVPPVLCSVFLRQWTSTGLLNSLISGFLLTTSFNYVLYLLLKKAPKSFTVGEAIIVAHGISTFCYSSYLKLGHLIFHMKVSKNELEVIGQCIQVAVLGSGLFAFLLVKNPSLKSPKLFYASASAIAAGLIIPGLFSILGQNPLIWFIDFILQKNSRVVLMALWTVSTMIAILVAAWKQSEKNYKKTVIRKYFHVLMLVAFLPGLFYDQNLLYFATGITFGIFIIIECFRVLNVPPLGERLKSAFSTFLDEKDQGPLILTHFYLLVGCSLPLWLVPEFSKDFHFAMLSGILSIGIGDMMASIGGTYFGRRIWPGTSKTVEGTMFSVFSQVFVCLLLNLSGFMIFPLSKMVLGIFLVSMLEAFTTQIDNLVLPLYLYLLFTV